MLKGGLPPRCRPTPTKGPTAAVADEPEVAFPASIAALMKLTFA